MAEVALIGSDIQEVIGSAIAIRILSNGLVPLWAGVVIIALDCFIFLFLENYGLRSLEAFFAVLIVIMALAFAWMFGEAKPSGKELLPGIVVPKLSSRTIQQDVEVVGCLIMPHNVFLHSALVQSRQIDHRNKSPVQEALNYYSIESTLALIVWSSARRFDQPHKYKPFVSRCVVRGNLEIGSLREVDVKSGLPATTSTERLELLDDDEHILSIRILLVVIIDLG
ncbi:START-like domain superfamily [Sesbania bispinosa]|nr:START-like domain superfamily [Sesbania bispinosa]